MRPPPNPPPAAHELTAPAVRGATPKTAEAFRHGTSFATDLLNQPQLHQPSRGSELAQTDLQALLHSKTEYELELEERSKRLASREHTRAMTPLGAHPSPSAPMSIGNPRAGSPRAGSSPRSGGSLFSRDHDGCPNPMETFDFPPRPSGSAGHDPRARPLTTDGAGAVAIQGSEKYGTQPAPLPPPNSRAGSAGLATPEMRAEEARQRNRKAWLAHGETAAVVLPGAASASVRSLTRSKSTAAAVAGGKEGLRLAGGISGAEMSASDGGRTVAPSASTGALSPGRPVGSTRGGPPSPGGHLYAVPPPPVGASGGGGVFPPPPKDRSQRSEAELVDISVPSISAMAAQGILMSGAPLLPPGAVKGASRAGLRTSPAGSMRTAGGARPLMSQGGVGLSSRKLPTAGGGRRLADVSAEGAGARTGSPLPQSIGKEQALLDLSSSPGTKEAMAVLAEHQAKASSRKMRSMGSNSTPAGYLLAGTIGTGPGRLPKHF